MPQILLVCQGENRLSCWASAFSALEFEVWTSPESLPQDIQLDVIVTNDPAFDPAQFSAPDNVGLIAVGCQRACDVQLPADCLPRELVLACRLLSEVVNLRRQRQTADGANRSLRTLAFADPLTGLANRRAWDDELALRFAESQSTGRPLCLAILDLDRFKDVNERHGYLRGDDALKAAASVLAQQVRKDDFVARLGGDEFGLLLWNLSPNAAGDVVERVRKSLGVNSSASAGYAISGGSFRTAEALFAEADQALREAKAAGRNCTRGPASVKNLKD